MQALRPANLIKCYLLLSEEITCREWGCSQFAERCAIVPGAMVWGRRKIDLRQPQLFILIFPLRPIHLGQNRRAFSALPTPRDGL